MGNEQSSHDNEDQAKEDVDGFSSFFSVCSGPRRADPNPQDKTYDDQPKERILVSANSTTSSTISQLSESSEKLLEERDAEIKRLRAKLKAKKMGPSTRTLKAIETSKAENEAVLKQKQLEIENLKRDLNKSRYRENTAVRTARNAMEKQQFVVGLESTDGDDDGLGDYGDGEEEEEEENGTVSHDNESVDMANASEDASEAKLRSMCSDESKSTDNGVQKAKSKKKNRRRRSSLTSKESEKRRKEQNLIAALDQQVANGELSLDEYAVALTSLSAKEPEM